MVKEKDRFCLYCKKNIPKKKRKGSLYCKPSHRTLNCNKRKQAREEKEQARKKKDRRTGFNYDVSLV